MAERIAARQLDNVINEFSIRQLHKTCKYAQRNHFYMHALVLKRLESMPSHIVGFTCSYTRRMKSKTRQEGYPLLGVMFGASERVFWYARQQHHKHMIDHAIMLLMEGKVVGQVGVGAECSKTATSPRPPRSGLGGIILGRPFPHIGKSCLNETTFHSVSTTTSTTDQFDRKKERSQGAYSMLVMSLSGREYPLDFAPYLLPDEDYKQTKEAKKD